MLTVHSSVITLQANMIYRKIKSSKNETFQCYITFT